MRLRAFYNKAFTGGYWMVGLRNKHCDDSIYKRILAPKGQWLADPFMFERNGRHFLFVEQYCNNKNRAGLGVFEIVDGQPINNRVIIDNPYHMSYPCVFEYKGDCWMIPESSSNLSLDLYKATEFPVQWEHERTLIEDRKMVDSTVYIQDDDVFLLSYESVLDGWLLHIFLMDMHNYSLSKVDEVHYNSNIGRPAGRLFQKAGKLYRPAQNCSSKYGESLYVYEVKELSKSSYSEQFAYELKSSDVRFEDRFDRIHTLNSDSCFEVIDVFQERFDLFHWWKIFKRSHLKK